MCQFFAMSLIASTSSGHCCFTCFLVLVTNVWQVSQKLVGSVCVHGPLLQSVAIVLELRTFQQSPVFSDTFNIGFI